MFNRDCAIILHGTDTRNWNRDLITISLERCSRTKRSTYFSFSLCIGSTLKLRHFFETKFAFYLFAIAWNPFHPRMWIERFLMHPLAKILIFFSTSSHHFAYWFDDICAWGKQAQELGNKQNTTIPYQAHCEFTISNHIASAQPFPFGTKCSSAQITILSLKIESAFCWRM